MELGYKGPRDVLILSKNLTSAMEAPSVIDNKLEEDKTFVYAESSQCLT